MFKSLPPQLCQKIGFLIIDANPDLFSFVESFLKPFQFNVLLAKETKEAVALLKAHRPLNVLIACDFPGTSPLQLAMMIKRANGNICVTMIVPEGDDNLSKSIAQEKQFLMLKKPYNKTEVVSHIQRHVVMTAKHLLQQNASAPPVSSAAVHEDNTSSRVVSQAPTGAKNPEDRLDTAREDQREAVQALEKENFELREELKRLRSQVSDGIIYQTLGAFAFKEVDLFKDKINVLAEHEEEITLGIKNAFDTVKEWSSKLGSKGVAGFIEDFSQPDAGEQNKKKGEAEVEYLQSFFTYLRQYKGTVTESLRVLELNLEPVTKLGRCIDLISGRVKPSSKNFYHLLINAIDLMIPVLEALNIDFDFPEEPEEPFSLAVDQQSFLHFFFHLCMFSIEQAQKIDKDRPQLHFKASRPGRTVKLKLEDNGSQIMPDSFELLLTGKTDPGNHLMLANGFLNGVKGTIRLEPNREIEGNIYVVELPVLRAD